MLRVCRPCPHSGRGVVTVPAVVLCPVGVGCAAVLVGGCAGVCVVIVDNKGNSVSIAIAIAR